MEFSSSQRSALDVFDRFIDDPNCRVMILTGAAGTGKTEMIAEFARRLNSRHRSAVLLAPTGQAAHRLGSRTGFDVRTIHAKVFGQGDFKDRGEEHPPQTEFPISFEMMPPTDSVYIIDESSFISNVPMSPEEKERAELIFGTTNLLDDILTHSVPRKIVFVGDLNQLPPIGLDYSPALDLGTFEKISVPAVLHHLTELHRRATDSPITILGWKLADVLESGRVDELPEVLDQPENGLSLLDSQELEDRDYEGLAIGTCAVVARSHASVASWNRKVRQKLDRTLDLPEVGDRLILSAACRQPTLANGEDLLVEGIDPSIETITETIRLNGKPEEVSIQLVHGKFARTGGGPSFETHLVLDACYSMDSERASIIRRVLWIDFVKRAAQLGLKRSHGREFWDFYNSDTRLNSLRATYAYARTVHKSQGGEWDTVITDLSSIRGASPMMLRVVYTAVTRAKSRLKIYIWPFAARYIDIEGIGHEFAQRIDGVLGLTSTVKPLQNGCQIASSDGSVLVNIFERARRLGTIHIQKAPADRDEQLRGIVRETELHVRAHLQPITEPQLVEKVARLTFDLAERELELYVWRPADFQIAFALRHEAAEAAVGFHHSATGALKSPLKVDGGTDEQLLAILEPAIRAAFS